MITERHARAVEQADLRSAQRQIPGQGAADIPSPENGDHATHQLAHPQRAGARVRAAPGYSSGSRSSSRGPSRRALSAERNPWMTATGTAAAAGG